MTTDSVPPPADRGAYESDESEAPSFSPLNTASSSESTSRSEPESTDVSSPNSPESDESITGNSCSPSSLYPTYKLVGDNVDKHVKPREMRVDAQAQSLHLFNLYAVRDRVDTSLLPDSPALPDLSTCKVKDVLPSREDHRAMFANFAILAGRVLKKYMPFFTRFASGLEKHISHKYDKEMAQNSEVVCMWTCGVIIFPVSCYKYIIVWTIHAR